jgi:hypothetical protein
MREILCSDTMRRNYICAAFDAIFGLWEAPGHCLFHLGKDPSEKDPETHPHPGARDHEHWVINGESIPRCIHSGLYFWEKAPARPDTTFDDKTEDDVNKTASVSLVAIDARLIQTRVPFKFEKTDRIDNHLVIDKSGELNKILIFTDWQRFLMLRHHKVLAYDSRRDYPEDEVTLFQLLSRSTRSAVDRIGGRGGDVRYIAYELLQTYALLFYRNISEKKGAFHNDAPPNPWKFFNCFRKIKSSKEIGKDLGLGRLDISLGFLQLVKVMAAPDDFGGEPQSGDFCIFRHRLEALNNELCVWKYSTFRDFWNYAGWIDDEYGFWGFVLSMAGVIFAIITITTSIVAVVLK